MPSNFDDFMGYVGGKSDAPAPEIKIDSHKIENNEDNCDAYAYEEQQEREAMMRTTFHPMKKWYTEKPQLTDKYGTFPLFWQDLKSWDNYREVHRLYLKYTDGISEVSELSHEKETSEVMKDEEDDKPKRRKKSRWGDAKEESNSESTSAPARKSRWERTSEEPPKKKSRWAPTGATDTGSLMTPDEQQSVILRARLDALALKMATVVQDAALIEKNPNRSPSPPPQYDSNGKRLNTREYRMRQVYERERMEIMDKLVKVNPLFKPPPEYLKAKLQRKLPIPIKEYPLYNFIGLIIGPRGNTQKRMEKEFNCRIAIRGRGSSKDGSKKAKQVMPDDHEELHVLITSENEEDLERAVKEVSTLLIPVDDTTNQHKQKQLRELALINGTLREDDFCHICGEKGHRQWECPNRDKTFKAVDVRCAICGDTSHPTSDCTVKENDIEKAAVIDKEYMNFMEQLGESSSSKGSGIISHATATALAGSSISKVNHGFSSASATSSVHSSSASTNGSVAAVGSTPETAFPPPTKIMYGATPETAYPPPTASIHNAQLHYPPLHQPSQPLAAGAYAPSSSTAAYYTWEQQQYMAQYYAAYTAYGWTYHNGIWYDANGVAQVQQQQQQPQDQTMVATPATTYAAFGQEHPPPPEPQQLQPPQPPEISEVPARDQGQNDAEQFMNSLQ